jgi:hypothetical protein
MDDPVIDEDDLELRQALKDLAPAVEDGGVWDSLEPRIAARRRRRRLALAGATVVVIACLGVGTVSAVHWWPHQTGVLVLGEGPLTGSLGEVVQVEIPLPTSYWTGDGTTADSAGGNTAVLHGDATYTDGLFGQAFYLDGDGDWVEVPDNPSLDPGAGDFTASVWVKYDSCDVEQIVMEKYGEFMQPRQGWTLARLPDGRMSLRMALDNQAESVCIESDHQDTPNGVWVFYAIRRAGGACTVFYNGLPIAGGPAPGDLSTDSSLEIGHRGNPQDTPGSLDDQQFYLHGAVDDVRHWAGTALSDQQILGLYAQVPPMEVAEIAGHVIDEWTGEALGGVVVDLLDGARVVASEATTAEGDYHFTAPPGTYLVSFRDWGYKTLVSDPFTAVAGAPVTLDVVLTSAAGSADAVFDDTTGTTLDPTLLMGPARPPDLPAADFYWSGDGTTDDDGGTHPAILHGDATYTEGLIGQAFYLDGDGDWVEVPDDPALNPGTGDFTATVWAKYDSFSTEQTIIEKYIEYDPRYGWTLTRMPDNRVRAHLAPDSLIESEPMNIPDGAWVFYAVRRAAGVVTVFFNGEPVASGPAPADLSTTASLKFGHRGNPDDTPGSMDERQFYTHGAIDDVRYWVGTALSDDDIRSLYAQAGR